MIFSSSGGINVDLLVGREIRLPLYRSIDIGAKFESADFFSPVAKHGHCASDLLLCTSKNLRPSFPSL